MFKRYFIAGLLIWLPILATLFVIKLILNILYSGINLLPEAYQPENWLGMHIPGLGIIVSLLVILMTGIIARNFFGRKIVHWLEKIVKRIPLIRTIYSGTKEILQTLVSSSSQSFRKVLLVEYPRAGMWSIAFQTGTGHPEVNAQMGKSMVSVFIPTTPNPTSGFLLLLPAHEAIELALSVEDALKYVVSLGTLTAGDKDKLVEETSVK